MNPNPMNNRIGKTITLLAFTLAALLVESCSRTPANFEPDFRKAQDTFMNADESAALAAMTAFLDKYKDFVPTAKDEKKLKIPCSVVLSISWLELYSLYYCQNETANADKAMQKTIFYADKSPASWLNASYVNDRQGHLHKQIFASYLTQTSPEWFEAYKGKIKNQERLDAPEPSIKWATPNEISALSGAIRLADMPMTFQQLRTDVLGDLTTWPVPQISYEDDIYMAITDPSGDKPYYGVELIIKDDKVASIKLYYYDEHGMTYYYQQPDQEKPFYKEWLNRDKEAMKRRGKTPWQMGIIWAQNKDESAQKESASDRHTVQ